MPGPPSLLAAPAAAIPNREWVTDGGGRRLRVLALSPFHGGSHRAFFDGWRRCGRHRWTLETLPASHWKWRMRGAAPLFADRVTRRLAAGETWDVVLTTDMLDLAAFRGLAPAPVRDLPAVVYFHENQLTYPRRHGDDVAQERDLHFAVTNLTSALAADAVWFNSAFHRDAWLAALPALLARLPDHRPRRAVERVAARSRVEAPGVDDPLAELPRRSAERAAGPLHLLWAARWEHDKAPQRFFAALDRLAQRGVDFRLSVLGQSFEQVPQAFAAARRRFAGRIERWGWQESRADYAAALAAADAVVSTADHEFFGLAVVEAVAAGCYPMLPRRLAYPEVLADADGAEDFFYASVAAEVPGHEPGHEPGHVAALADRLAELAQRLESGGGRRRTLWRGDPERGRRAVERYLWPTRAPALDDALAAVAG